ncbi:MAG TPA: Sua5 family C-terminal domain-containing protein, partial [Pyrinomonadaceae bacterium]
TPLVAPSANLSGRPSPTDWRAVYEDLNGRIDCILKGEATEFGLESTVIDCTTKNPLVLRFGAISLEDLRQVVPETEIYQAKSGETVKSPGLKHKHYAPRARIKLVSGSTFPVLSSAAKAYIGLNQPKSVEFDLIKTCRSIENYAHEVFAFFRECDRAGIETIYCEIIEEKGIGAALMDRLRRASEN